jgi:hypothetical protein
MRLQESQAERALMQEKLNEKLRRAESSKQQLKLTNLGKLYRQRERTLAT